MQVRSGESLAARELKSGAVAHKFGAAGEVESDSYTGRSEFVYQELRDRKVALFVTRMPQGVWEIRYSLRAEAPGAFHALPVTGQAMYVPEIKCNDQEMLVKVVDR